MQFNCPHCQQPLEATPDMVGKNFQCPACSKPLQVPATPPPSAPPPPATVTASFDQASTPPPAAPRTPGFAIASLVFGILSITCCISCLFIMFPILAIVFGHLSLSQIKKQPDVFTGKGLALAGLILGYIGLVLMICATVVGVVLNLKDPEAFQRIFQQ